MAFYELAHFAEPLRLTNFLLTAEMPLLVCYIPALYQMYIHQKYFPLRANLFFVALSALGALRG